MQIAKDVEFEEWQQRWEHENRRGPLVLTADEIEQISSLRPDDDERYVVVERLAGNLKVGTGVVWCAYADALIDGRAELQRWY